MGAILVFITQYLQLVEGLSPLRAGLWMLPAAAASTAGFQLAPLIARRIRPAVLIAGGLAVSVTGLLVITQAGAASGLAALVTGYALINLGAGPLVTLGTDLAAGSVPPERADGGGSDERGRRRARLRTGHRPAGQPRHRHLPRPDPRPPPRRGPGQSRQSRPRQPRRRRPRPKPGQHGAALLAAARHAFTSGLHKSRLVPLHPSSMRALESYAQLRDQLQPRPAEPAFLVSLKRKRLLYAVVSQTFRQLINNAGIGAGAVSPPRPHDLRHTPFAVRGAGAADATLPRLAGGIFHA